MCNARNPASIFKQLPMKYGLFLLLAYSTLAAFSQDTSHPAIRHYIMDTAAGKALIRPCSRSAPPAVQGFYVPSPETVQEMEEVFNRLQDLVARNCCVMGDKLGDIHTYDLQYLGVLIQGKRFIYINAFPKTLAKELLQSHLDPHTTPVVACDGGAGFWGALFEVETKQFSELAFNGIG